MSSKPISYSLQLTVNGQHISTVKIGRHYLVKHGSYMNDPLILELVLALDGGDFPVDSTTDGINYYVADVVLEDSKKKYRIIWLFEGDQMEILGIIHAYRRRKKQ